MKTGKDMRAISAKMSHITPNVQQNRVTQMSRQQYSKTKNLSLSVKPSGKANCYIAAFELLKCPYENASDTDYITLVPWSAQQI